MVPSHHTDDLTLFRQVAEGDESAFATIFHRFTPKIRPFVLGIVKVPEVADELVQDLFLKVWLNRQNLVGVTEPSAWLYKVASNLALNQLRRQASEYRRIKALVDSSGTDADDLFSQFTAKELQQVIRQAVNALPEKRREVYLLSRDEGLSHKEIADKLGISVNTVKNQVVSALKAIQDHIFRNTGVYIPLVLLSTKINSSLA